MVEHVELLVVDSGGRRCALPSDAVVEVHQTVLPERLPFLPDWVEGIVDVRGAVLPVIDLQARLGGEPRPVCVTDHMVVVRASERTVVLRVAGALEFLTMPVMVLDSLAAAVTHGHETCGGAVQMAEGLVLVHDLGAFLSPMEAIALDEVVARAADQS